MQDPSFTTTLRHKDALALAKDAGFAAKPGTVAAQWFAEAGQHYKNMDEAMVIDIMNAGNESIIISCGNGFCFNDEASPVNVLTDQLPQIFLMIEIL